MSRLWTQARLWTGQPEITNGSVPQEPVLEDYAILSDESGRIAWIGPAAEADRSQADEVIECGGRLITPGLIDCHTHLVYAGDRAGEWRMRLEGRTYEEVARAGGGIVSTVKSVREASEEQLINESLPRLDALIADGVTTVEIKSGYGLNQASEAKMLRVAGRLGELRPVTIRRTYLGAHARPPEAAGNEEYIDEIVNVDLPELAGQSLFDAVDGFCETIGFTREQMERVFRAADALDLPVKLHAEQLSDQNGAQLAAEYGALSADHLEYLDEAGVRTMAEHGTIAVLLPGAYYVLLEEQRPPIDLFRAYGVPMAVATDCNPGSSPVQSLRLALNMACTLFRLTPHEALLGATRNAALALGLQDSKGQLAVGFDCDLAIWDVAAPETLIYELGSHRLHQRVWGGN